MPAVQGDQVAAGRGRSAARVPESVRDDRPDAGEPVALRQTVHGAERSGRTRQTVPVLVGRPLSGVQG